jgi:hypothetical protein
MSAPLAFDYDLVCRWLLNTKDLLLSRGDAVQGVAVVTSNRRERVRRASAPAGGMALADVRAEAL